VHRKDRLTPEGSWESTEIERNPGTRMVAADPPAAPVDAANASAAPAATNAAPSAPTAPAAATTAPARDHAAVQALVDEILARGHAVNAGEWEHEAPFAAVAVPLRSGTQLLGAVNLVFPEAAVSNAELQRRYPPRLHQLAQRIGKDAQLWLD
jgi:DNA-binding IclR family transcriptional regulator